MFLGHYAVGFAAKKWTPKISLGTLFFASVWLDLLWSLFLVLGWESVAISPGITKVIPIDFVDYSLSHSLIMALAWAAFFGLISLITTKDEKTSLVIMGLVVSHWFLNVVVHRPDMLLLPSGSFAEVKWGLGLWNSVPGTILVEGLIFAAGLWVYLKNTRAGDAIGQMAFWGMCVALIGIFTAFFFMPVPKSAGLVAIEGQIQLLFVAWAYWVDDHRKPA